MSMKSLLSAFSIALVLCLAIAVPASAADAAAPKPSGKWILYFDSWSEADGEMALRVAPETGDPVEVTIKIPKGTHENAAAQLVAGTLKGQLGGGYSVKVEDGEKVYIKNKGKTPKFVVSLANSTVTGLKLKIKRS
jgi:hypothetical protein